MARLLISAKQRILTIGDGDLSFSNALALTVRPQALTATVYDSMACLEEKYGLENYQALRGNETQVLSQFDVTEPASWLGLDKHSFDVVIFQFPLIPNDASEQGFSASSKVGDANLRNRRLLHLYLKHAQQYFLDPKGERLMIITSKDVKPYRQWNIEQSITANLTMNYLGQSPFKSDDFPQYKIRNVDRDKFVKQTLGISYYYSDKPQPQLAEQLLMPEYLTDHNHYCAMCRVGPMRTTSDLTAHQHSKRHLKMSGYEQRWHEFIMADQV